MGPLKRGGSIKADRGFVVEDVLQPFAEIPECRKTLQCTLLLQCTNNAGHFFYMLTIDFMILSDATIIQWGVWESCDPTVEVSGEVATLLSSLMLSHPHPQVENVWWLDLNFLSRKGAPQVHDYCAKNTIIRHVLCLLLDLLCSLAFK